MAATLSEDIVAPSVASSPSTLTIPPFDARPYFFVRPAQPRVGLVVQPGGRHHCLLRWRCGGRLGPFEAARFGGHRAERAW